MSLPRLIPLVILRGSGETTAALAAEAAAHGVRTLAHADGGGVLYVDARRRPRAGARAGRAQPRPPRRLQPAQPAADRRGRSGTSCCRASSSGSRRLGVRALAAAARPPARATSGRSTTATRPPSPSPRPPTPPMPPGSPTRRPRASRPPSSPRTRAPPRPSSRPTPARARSGTPPRACSTASSCSAAPETGINVDHVPGPRGPVTYRDLHLRQYVVTPEAQAPGAGPGRSGDRARPPRRPLAIVVRPAARAGSFHWRRPHPSSSSDARHSAARAHVGGRA